MSAGDGPMLADALSLAARGWLVVPLHTPGSEGCSCHQAARCKSPGKHPRIDQWPHRATTDAAQITAWWEQWPEANIGIVTGRRSGVVVLDVDPRHQGDELLADCERIYGRLPKTVTVTSGGGGEHYYFRAPADCRTVPYSRGLSLLAETGLVVAPPSYHSSGGRYEWDEHPDETALAEPPTWLRNAPPRSKRGKLISSDIPEGERNTTLTSIAGRLRLVLLHPEGLAETLHAVNEARCRPPLAAAEVEQIARSASRWHALPWHTSPRQFLADERLSPNARLVLHALSLYANVRGEAWPSYEQIKKLTGIKSPTTISKVLTELEHAERISRKRRFNNSTAYRISRLLPVCSIDDEQPAPLVLSFQNLEEDDEAVVEGGSA